MYERDSGWGRLLSISSIIGSQRLKDDQRTSVFFRLRQQKARLLTDLEHREGRGKLYLLCHGIDK